MTTTTERCTKDVMLNLVVSAEERKLIAARADKWQRFPEWIRGVALNRAHGEDGRRPDPGERVGIRKPSTVLHLRVTKHQYRLFAKAARPFKLKVQEWLRDLALEACRT